ncbi:MAG: tol-pal system-associated acyl-CoA thioesterase [Alphaproteobacteria bacterium]
MPTAAEAVAGKRVSAAERMLGHQFPLRVYYEDTDAGGIVYYANYLKFAERARTEMLRELGFSHGDLHHTQSLGFVVRRCCVEYRHSARLDESLTVQTLIATIRGASFDLRQLIWRDERITASLEVTLAMVDGRGRAARLPKSLIAALTPQYRVGK